MGRAAANASVAMANRKMGRHRAFSTKAQLHTSSMVAAPLNSCALAAAAAAEACVAAAAQPPGCSREGWVGGKGGCRLGGGRWAPLPGVLPSALWATCKGGTPERFRPSPPCCCCTSRIQAQCVPAAGLAAAGQTAGGGRVAGGGGPRWARLEPLLQCRVLLCCCNGLPA